jgi:hypothetical protein
MAETKKFGPYKGSEANGGRPIYVYKKKVGSKWVTTSKNKARADYESKNGKLSKGTDVDHKDNNKNNDSKGNLRAIKKSANVAKENKRRAGKKENEK